MPRNSSDKNDLDLVEDDWDPHSGTIDNFDKPFVLYAAREKGLKGYYKGLLLAAPLFVLQAYTQLSRDPELWPAVLISFLLIVAGFLYLRRKRAMAVKPIIKMHSEGLEIHTIRLDLVIPWEQVREARAFNFINTHLGIETHDINKALSQSAFGTRVRVLLNHGVIPFYRLFGVTLTGIFIDEADLPLPADEVAELINNRRNHVLALKQSKTD